MEIKISRTKTLGKIKPMHAVGGGPDEPSLVPLNAREIFKEIGVPACRLHDVAHPYGANQFIDVHCIFPNFDADENDEYNYNFAPSDRYILAIIESGAEVFYRLGESIDHYDKKLYVRPPKDMHKWARICEHIIRHYNEGWAGGYYLGIKYWEIWNEPEGRTMWRGTYSEFYELYSITAKHLKSCFPTLMIGGYSCVGLYAAIRDHNHERYNPWFNTMLPFMDGFFEYIKDSGAPIDFFSWHIYTLSPEEVVAAAKFVRGYLDERGYNNTESYLTEFNFSYSLRSKPTLYQHTEFPSDLLATMIAGQSAPVDMIFYYDLRPGMFNGAFYLDPLDKEIKKLPGFTSLKFFGDLYRLGNMLETSYDEGNGLYVLSASDGERVGVALASRAYEGRVEISLDAESADVVKLAGSGIPEEYAIKVNAGKAILDVNPETIYYVSC